MSSMDKPRVLDGRSITTAVSSANHIIHSTCSIYQSNTGSRTVAIFSTSLTWHFVLQTLVEEHIYNSMAPCPFCPSRLCLASLECQGGAPVLQDSEFGFLFEAFEEFLLPAVLVWMLHHCVRVYANADLVYVSASSCV